MQNVLKKAVSLVLVSLFIATLINVTVSQAAKDIMLIKGTITAISDEADKIGVKDESGIIHTLTLNDKVDIKKFNTGDKVLIECDHEGLIESVSKEG